MPIPACVLIPGGTLGGNQPSLVFRAPVSRTSVLSGVLSLQCSGPLDGGLGVKGPQPCSLSASPVVKPLPSAVRALVEEEVLLPCAAWGVPRPSITWQKEGLGIPEGESALSPEP